METLFLTLMQFVFERLPAYISINLILSKNYKLNSKLKRHIFFDLYKMYLKLILLFYYYTNSSNIFGYIHQTLDFCALEVCVFDFCALPNDRPPSKFAGQTLDFCAVLEGKTIEIVQKILDITIFPCIF